MASVGVLVAKIARDGGVAYLAAGYRSCNGWGVAAHCIAPDLWPARPGHALASFLTAGLGVAGRVGSDDAADGPAGPLNHLPGSAGLRGGRTTGKPHGTTAADEGDADRGNDGGGGGGRGDGGDGGGDDGHREDEGERRVRWVTIATFSLPTEAHLARLRLEAADIACLLLDEHMVSVNWLLSPAVGGIKLQVPEDQVESARLALGGDVIEWDESEADALAICPHCRQGEFAMAPVPRWVLIVSVLLLGIPLLFLPRVWRCTVCNRPMPTVPGHDRAESGS